MTLTLTKAEVAIILAALSEVGRVNSHNHVGTKKLIKKIEHQIKGAK